MARPLRIGVPGGEYHVTCRGLERRAIVRDDADRARWLSLLSDVADRREWRVLAWALMANHFHLFVRTPAADISAGMHDLNSAYAGIFNRRHRRVGPLLQGRFGGDLPQPQTDRRDRPADRRPLRRRRPVGRLGHRRESAPQPQTQANAQRPAHPGRGRPPRKVKNEDLTPKLGNGSKRDVWGGF